MKTINLSLVGLDSGAIIDGKHRLANAFSLMGAFSKQAKREGWAVEEIKSVIDEAMSGDYDKLLATLDKHCEVGENKESNEDLICTRCKKEVETYSEIVYSQGSKVCTDCKKETLEDDKRAFDRDMNLRCLRPFSDF